MARQAGSFLLCLTAGVAASSAYARSDLPTEITDLRLADIEVRPEPHHHHGRVVEGRLPTGEWIRIDLDDRDTVQEVESESRRGFHLSDVSSIVPRAVLERDELPRHALIEKIEFHDRDEIEIEGWDEDNREFKARVTMSGRVIELKLD
jgi:hypothetical protein